MNDRVDPHASETNVEVTVWLDCGRVVAAAVIHATGYDWCQRMPAEDLRARAERGVHKWADPFQLGPHDQMMMRGLNRLRAVLEVAPSHASRTSVPLPGDWLERVSNSRRDSRELAHRLVASGLDRPETVVQFSWPEGKEIVAEAEPHPALRASLGAWWAAEAEAEERRRVARDREPRPLSSAEVPAWLTSVGAEPEVVDFAEQTVRVPGVLVTAHWRELKLRTSDQAPVSVYLAPDAITWALPQGTTTKVGQGAFVSTSAIGSTEFARCDIEGLTRLSGFEAGLLTQAAFGHSASETFQGGSIGVDEVRDALVMRASFGARQDYGRALIATLESLSPESDPSSDRHGLSGFLNQLAGLANTSVDPFAGFQEAPQPIIELHERHGDAFRHIAGDHADAIGTLLHDATAVAYADVIDQLPWARLERRGIPRTAPIEPDVDEWDW